MRNHVGGLPTALVARRAQPYRLVHQLLEAQVVQILIMDLKRNA